MRTIALPAARQPTPVAAASMCHARIRAARPAPTPSANFSNIQSLLAARKRRSHAELCKPSFRHPTILSLVGLADDYPHEGRALTETFTGWSTPSAVRKSAYFVPLEQAFKQINAPVGALGLASLQASTAGLESNDAGDSTYNFVEGQLATFTSQRDALAGQMLNLREGAAFNNQPIPDQQAIQLIQQAQALLHSVRNLANNP